MSDRHHAFISHRHEDDALVSGLKDLLREHGVEVRDSSVTTATPNSANAENYIKSILSERIRWAGKVIVIVSPETKNHEWIDWEVDFANRHPGKRIIGVWAPGAGECDLPEALARHADAVVSWNAEKIIEALDGVDNWESPDGSQRPVQDISRIGC